MSQPKFIIMAWESQVLKFSKKSVGDEDSWEQSQGQRVESLTKAWRSGWVFCKYRDHNKISEKVKV